MHQIKFGRAHEHLEHVQSEIRTWLQAKPYRIIHDYDRKQALYVISVDDIDLAALEQLPAVIGDCLQNIRSGLNYLALELASAVGPVPDDVLKDSEFPIFGDRDRSGRLGVGATNFATAGYSRIRAVDPAAQAVIEGLQPYHGGASAFETHPLWVLHELANVDRHRLLHIAVLHLAGSWWKPHDGRNLAQITTQITIKGGVIDGHAVIAEFDGIVPIDPDEDVYVNLEPGFDIAFGPGTPLVEGESISDTLGGIYLYVMAEVVIPLSKFLPPVTPHGSIPPVKG